MSLAHAEMVANRSPAAVPSPVPLVAKRAYIRQHADVGRSGSGSCSASIAFGMGIVSLLPALFWTGCIWLVCRVAVRTNAGRVELRLRRRPRRDVHGGASTTGRASQGALIGPFRNSVTPQGWQASTCCQRCMPGVPGGRCAQQAATYCACSRQGSPDRHGVALV